MQEKEEQDEEGSEKKVALQCNTWQHSAVRSEGGRVGRRTSGKMVVRWFSQSAIVGR